MKYFMIGVLLVAVTLAMGAGVAYARVFGNNGHYDPCTCKLPSPAAPVAVGKVLGPAKLKTDDTEVHTVVLLPTHWKSCEPCVRIWHSFNSDSELLDIRKQTRYWVLVAGTPDFNGRGWATRYPEVAQGNTVVVLTQGGRELAKFVSPNVVGLGGKLRDKLCNKFCPNCPKPEPTPEPTPEPETPDVTPMPDMPMPSPVQPANDVNPLAMAAVVVVVGFVAWLVMFKQGM